MSKAKIPNIRISILNILLASLPRTDKNFQQQALLNLFPPNLKDQPGASQSLAKNICYGVFRHYFFLNAVIQNHLEKPLRNKDFDVHVVLMAGLYELLFLNTPEHAVISEWVQACQKLKKPWSKALVNAVLRNVQRKALSAEELKQQISNHSQDPELKYEHPKWLIEQLALDWPDRFESIISANNHESLMTLRINASKINPSDYLILLEKSGVKALQSQNTEGCIFLQQAVDINSLPHFEEGFVSIQDEAAQQAARLLNLTEGLKVLDACSAPGGKAAHMLENCNDLDLLCLDISEQRLKKVEQNFKRLGLKAKLKHADAANIDAWWDGRAFDRILLDAPCSASGIIRRHPDIKLARTQEDLHRLALQQLKLLNTLWHCLKPEGLLLYATCSVFKTENEELVRQFLTQNTNALEQDVILNIGEKRDCGWQLFPDLNSHDGFYYCLLKKCS